MKVIVLRGLGYASPRVFRNHPPTQVNIGYRPIIWHVMKYYAHIGHKDFILCLGHRIADLEAEQLVLGSLNTVLSGTCYDAR